MQWAGYDWDDGNWPKCGQHGVHKLEIEAVFNLPTTQVFLDPAHSSAKEDRYFAVALDIAGHAGIFVGFTLRRVGGEVCVRPVTARYMHKREAMRYA